MPGQTSWHGSAADELVGQQRMDVEDRINLGRGHIRPAEAEPRHAQLHRPEHEARFLAHRLRRLIAAPNDASFIAGAALAGFAASGGDKAARRAVFARHRIAEGVERRRGGRVDFWAHVRAGNRVDLLAEDPPRSEPLNIMPIKRNKAGVGELRRGAQLAGAERGRRASDAGEVGFDGIKTVGQRQGPREARALDAEAGFGRNPARILELVADEAVSAGWERLNGRHGCGLCLGWERAYDYAASCFCHPGLLDAALSAISSASLPPTTQRGTTSSNPSPSSEESMSPHRPGRWRSRTEAFARVCATRLAARSAETRRPE